MVQTTQFNIIANIISKVSGARKQLTQQKTSLNMLKNRLDFEREILSSRKEITRQTRAETKIGFKEQLRDAQKNINLNKQRMAIQQKALSSSQSEAQKAQQVAQKAISSASELTKKQSEIRRVMKATKLSVNDASRAMGNLGFRFDKTGKAVDALGKKMVLGRKNINAMRKSVKLFDMSQLSLLFGMMALKNAIGGFLKSAVTSYNRATDESSAFRKETNKVTAAWEFFKFSMIDALSKSELFKVLITVLVQIINWFNKLTPTTKMFIFIGLAVLFVAATIAFLVAQVRLLGLTNLIVFGWIILLVVGLGLFIWGLIKIWKNWGKNGKEVMKGIAIAMIGLGIIIMSVLLMIGFGFVALWLLIPILVGVAILLIINHWDSLKIAWIKLWAGIKIISLKALDFIIEIMVNKIGRMVSIMKKIPGLGRLVEGADQALNEFRNFADKRIAIIKEQRDAEVAAIKQVQAERKAAAESEKKTAGGFLGGIIGNNALFSTPSGVGTSTNNNNTTIDQSVNEFNLSLPDVTNGQELMEQIQEIQSNELFKTIGSANE